MFWDRFFFRTVFGNVRIGHSIVHITIFTYIYIYGIYIYATCMTVGPRYYIALVCRLDGYTVRAEIFLLFRQDTIDLSHVVFIEDSKFLSLLFDPMGHSWENLQ